MKYIQSRTNTALLRSSRKNSESKTFEFKDHGRRKVLFPKGFFEKLEDSKPLIRCSNLSPQLASYKQGDGANFFTGGVEKGAYHKPILSLLLYDRVISLLHFMLLIRCFTYRYAQSQKSWTV